MSSAAYKDYLQDVADYFIQSLENESAVWTKPWKACKSVMPHNPATGTVYKGFNSVYLTMLQMRYESEDPRWMTYANAKKNGMHIKAKSKAAKIIFFDTIPVDKNGKKVDDKDKAIKFIPIFKPFNVFHASQIEGMPELKIEPIKDLSENHKKAQEFVDNTKANINHDQGDRCYYSATSDSIHMVPRNSFENEGEYFSTLIHELSHWTGHSSRLNRKLGNMFGSKEYAKEELRAEIASYMLSRELQVDFNPRNSAAYVKSWCSILQEKPDEIVKACHDAGQIVTFCSDLQKLRTFDKTPITPQKEFSVGIER